MEYSVLGSSGVQVSRLCLGAMMFGSPANESDSIKIIERALMPESILSIRRMSTTQANRNELSAKQSKLFVMM